MIAPWEFGELTYPLLVELANQTKDEPINHRLLKEIMDQHRGAASG